MCHILSHVFLTSQIQEWQHCAALELPHGMQPCPAHAHSKQSPSANLSFMSKRSEKTTPKKGMFLLAVKALKSISNSMSSNTFKQACCVILSHSGTSSGILKLSRGARRLPTLGAACCQKQSTLPAGFVRINLYAPSDLHRNVNITIPVVPHKAVAEFSKIGNL